MLSEKRKIAADLTEKIRQLTAGFEPAVVSIACATIAAEVVINAGGANDQKRDMLGRLHVTTFSALVAVGEIERGIAS